MIRDRFVFDLALVAIVLVAVFIICRPALIAARHRRRSRGVPGVIPIAVDGAAAWTVDRALKALAAAAAREGVILPGLVSVVVDGAHVRLYPATPVIRPPAPWTSSEQGTEWTASHDDLQLVGIEAGTRQPFPGLLTLGVSRAGRVLVDLDQAGGIIALQGEPADREAATRRIISELTTNPWSARTRLLLHGLDDVHLDRSGIESPESLDEVLSAVTSGGRGVALLRDAPLGQRGSDLVEALADEACHWNVVVVGTARYARWRFTAEKDGRITSDSFPETSWNLPVRQGLPVA